MFSSFVPSKARPLASRPHLIPIIFVVCLAGTVLPPSLLNNLSIGSIALYLSAQIPKATSGRIAQDYMLPIQTFLAVMQWVDFCVLHSPDEFSRDKDEKKVPKTWREKLSWAWDLNTTYRGIGWNWRVKNVPEAAPLSTTKWDFVRTEALKACLFYLLYDLCWYQISISPYTSTSSDIFSDSLPRQAFFALMVGILNYCTLNLQYSVASAFTVAVGMYTPQEWPRLMGRLSDVSTVRDFWGKFWHQNLRRKLTLPFEILTEYIPIRHGTLLSRYMQLYMAFITTSLIHHLGAMNLSTSSSEVNLTQLAFFMLQPVAITVEDLIVYLWEKAGLKASRSTKALGSLWAFAWFTYSLRFAVAFFTNTGVLSEAPLPSLIHGVLGLITRISGGPSLKEL